MEEVLGVIPALVTENQNKGLMAPIIKNEVKDALGGLGRDKAPSPDDFLAMFFQKLGHIFQKELWEVVEESRAGGFVLKDFNNSFVSLLPKKETQVTFEEFRPISLYNMVHKIISKVMENRLK